MCECFGEEDPTYALLACRLNGKGNKHGCVCDLSRREGGEGGEGGREGKEGKERGREGGEGEREGGGSEGGKNKGERVCAYVTHMCILFLFTKTS